MTGRALRGQAKRAGVWLGVLGLLAVATALLWLGTPFHGTDAGIDSLEAADDVVVERTDGGGYVLRPPGNPTDAGVVFYPGARVHPDAYLTALAPLVREQHVTVVVPRMPLNFALLDHRAADTVRRAHPAIDSWYVGGHSLGGVAACRYAASADGALAGLFLYASYCDVDVAGADLRVLSVTGTADTVLDRERYEDARGRLPDDARFVALDGLNHTQFGDYRGQADDRPSTLTYAVAHDRLANATLAWLGG